MFWQIGQGLRLRRTRVWRWRVCRRRFEVTRRVRLRGRGCCGAWGQGQSCPLPDLDANANAVAIQMIKLENEGWERDYEVTEPSEPSFTEPAA